MWPQSGFAAGTEGRTRGACRGGRRMPQLGLHPDQGAAEKRTGLHLLQIGGALRAHPRGRGVPRPGKDLARSRGVAETMSKGVAFLLKKNNIDLIQGFGRLTAAGRLEVDGTHYEADHIILATGARPRGNGVQCHRRPARDFVAPGADAHPAARNDGRRRLGRHRQRVRVVLRRAGREGHRGGVHAPHDAARGRGGVEGDGARIPQTAGGGG